MALTRNPNRFDDPDVLLTEQAVEEMELYDPMAVTYGTAKRLRGLEQDRAAQATSITELAAAKQAVIPFTVGTYTGRPADLDTFEVDVDGNSRTYEMLDDIADLSDPTFVGVLRDADEDGDIAALVAKINDPSWQGGASSDYPVQNILAVQVAGSNKLYLYPADAPGGTPVAGASNITITNGLTNMTFLRTDLDDTPGVGTTLDVVAPFKVTVGAAELLLANQPILCPLGFDPQSWQVQVRDAAGQLQPDTYCAVTAEAVGDQNYLGLEFTPAAPTSLLRKEFVLPLGAGGVATHFEWNPARGVVPVGYKFVRGDALAGVSLEIALDRITRSTGAVQAALSTAVSVAGGADDVEQTFTPSVAISGDNHAISATQGLKGTLTPDATATEPGSITFIVEYYQPAVATDEIHVVAFG